MRFYTEFDCFFTASCTAVRGIQTKIWLYMFELGGWGEFDFVENQPTCTTYTSRSLRPVEGGYMG